jgi:hypothetical protein
LNTPFQFIQINLEKVSPEGNQTKLTMSSNDSINRYSMPVTRSRTGLYDVGLDQTNTTRFLFGDEDSNALGHSVPDENFPTLVRRDDQIVSSLFI